MTFKKLRNTTAAAIFIPDVGVNIPAGYTYTIPPANYGLWAASTSVVPYIQNGNLVVNTGFADLDPLMGDFLIKTGVGSWFGNDSCIPGITITDALNYIGCRGYINKTLRNETLGAVPGVEYTHVNYTVPIGKRLIWIGGKGLANSWTRWEIKVDTIPVFVDNNAFDKPSVTLHPGGLYKLDAGQVLLVKTKSTSQLNNTSEIETFLYFHEEDI